MTKEKVYVDCARGYTREPFASEKEAQAWIERMDEHHARDSRMCAGPHKIRPRTPADGTQEGA